MQSKCKAKGKRKNFQGIKNEHENNQNNFKKGIINEMFNENHQIDQEEILSKSNLIFFNNN